MEEQVIDKTNDDNDTTKDSASEMLCDKPDTNPQKITGELDFYKKEYCKHIQSGILSEIKKAYPNEKAENYEQLPKEFINLMAALEKSNVELDATDIYGAIVAKAERMRKNTPPSTGSMRSVSLDTAREFYTKAEVENMTPAEIKKNFTAIEKSIIKW